jgi:hypothetical protein
MAAFFLEIPVYRNIRGSSVNEYLPLNPLIISTAIWIDEYTDNQTLFYKDKEDRKTEPRYPIQEEESVNRSQIEVKQL